MIQVHDVKQGSREWWALRIGTPTVSSLARILTPKKLEYSGAAQTYAAELIAERILGRPLDDNELDTIWTERGKEEEAEARRWYAAYRECDVQQVGFITNELGGGIFGGSPDGLIGDVGGVEIKCRGAKSHMACVLGVNPIAGDLQVQGYLWLTRRSWWDVVAYNSELPKRIERHERIPAVQTAITDALDHFFEDVRKGEEQLAKHGDVVDMSDDLLRQLIASVGAG